MKNNLIDTALSKLDVIDHPDLIILCTPISTYVDLTSRLSNLVTKKSILTDIGSSKGIFHNKIYRKLSSTKISYFVNECFRSYNRSLRGTRKCKKKNETLKSKN